MIYDARHQPNQPVPWPAFHSKFKKLSRSIKSVSFFERSGFVSDRKKCPLLGMMPCAPFYHFRILYRLVHSRNARRSNSVSRKDSFDFSVPGSPCGQRSKRAKRSQSCGTPTASLICGISTLSAQRQSR